MSAVSNQEKQIEVLEYPFHEQIAIIVPEALLEGYNYTLKIEYSANISSSYYGFYGTSYTDEHNEKKYVALLNDSPSLLCDEFCNMDSFAHTRDINYNLKKFRPICVK